MNMWLGNTVWSTRLPAENTGWVFTNTPVSLLLQLWSSWVMMPGSSQRLSVSCGSWRTTASTRSMETLMIINARCWSLWEKPWSTKSTRDRRCCRDTELHCLPPSCATYTASGLVGMFQSNSNKEYWFKQEGSPFFWTVMSTCWTLTGIKISCTVMFSGEMPKAKQQIVFSSFI